MFEVELSEIERGKKREETIAVQQGETCVTEETFVHRGEMKLLEQEVD